MAAPRSDGGARIAVLPSSRATPEVVLRRLLAQADSLEGLIIMPIWRGENNTIIGPSIASEGITSERLAFTGLALAEEAMRLGEQHDESCPRGAG